MEGDKLKMHSLRRKSKNDYKLMLNPFKKESKSKPFIREPIVLSSLGLKASTKSCTEDFISKVEEDKEDLLSSNNERQSVVDNMSKTCSKFSESAKIQMDTDERYISDISVLLSRLSSNKISHFMKSPTNKYQSKKISINSSEPNKSLDSINIIEESTAKPSKSINAHLLSKKVSNKRKNSESIKKSKKRMTKLNKFLIQDEKISLEESDMSKVSILPEKNMLLVNQDESGVSNLDHSYDKSQLDRSISNKSEILRSTKEKGSFNTKANPLNSINSSCEKKTKNRLLSKITIEEEKCASTNTLNDKSCLDDHNSLNFTDNINFVTDKENVKTAASTAINSELKIQKNRSKKVVNKKRLSKDSLRTLSGRKGEEKKKRRWHKGKNDATSTSAHSMDTPLEKSLKKKRKIKPSSNSTDIYAAETHTPEIQSHDLCEVNMPVIGTSNVNGEVTKSKDLMNRNRSNQKQPCLKKGNRKYQSKKKGRKRTQDRDDLPPKNETPKNKAQRFVRKGRRFSVTGNWYIASGFLSDIIDLLDAFINTEGWRFKDFASCWRSKFFSLVYRGRQTFKELLEFSEEMALLTKRFLGPPHSTKRRIGALYALYGLYYKFPLGRQFFFNLRFELNEYEDLLELILPFRSNPDNPDPAFVFLKLELDGAIWHCATPYEPCYDFHNEDRERVETEYWKERLATSSSVSVAISEAQLNQDSDLLNYYCSVKSNLAHDVVPEKALSMLSSAFLEDVQVSLNQLRKDTHKELGVNVETKRKSGSTVGSHNISQENELSEESLEAGCESTPAKKVAESRNFAQKLYRNQSSADYALLQDDEVLRFMRLPEAQYLETPIDLCRSLKGSRKSKVTTFCDVENDDDLNSLENPLIPKPQPNQNQELHQALLPIHSLPKKHRRDKRTRALRKAAMATRKIKPLIGKNFPFIKDLETPADESVKGPFSFDDKIKFSFSRTTNSNECNTLPKNAVELNDEIQFSQTLNSDECEALPEVTVERSETIINVQIQTEEACKWIKLKIKMGHDQFRELQRDIERFETFKTNLFPLIKAVLNEEDRDRDWLIADIQMESQSKFNKCSNSANETRETEEKRSKSMEGSIRKQYASSNKSSSVRYDIPLKQKFECLKHSDSESDESVEEYSDNDDSLSHREKAAIDLDYSPPSGEERQDSSDYDHETEEELDLSYDCDNYAPIKRRRKYRSFRSVYEYERGPRDSDKLLALKNESKRISMVPIKVGDSVRYISIENEGDNDKKDLTQVKYDFEDIFPFSEEDKYYTWNDYSSNVKPPYKKKNLSRGSPYIFAPGRYSKRCLKTNLHGENMDEECEIEQTADRRKVQLPTAVKKVQPSPAVVKKVQPSSTVVKKVQPSPAVLKKAQPRRSMRLKEKRDLETTVENTESSLGCMKTEEDFALSPIKIEKPSLIDEISEDWNDGSLTIGKSEIESYRISEEDTVNTEEMKELEFERHNSARNSSQHLLNFQDSSMSDPADCEAGNSRTRRNGSKGNCFSVENGVSQVFSREFFTRNEVEDERDPINIGHSVISTSNYGEHVYNTINRSHTALSDLQGTTSESVCNLSAGSARCISPIHFVPMGVSDDIQEEAQVQPRFETFKVYKENETSAPFVEDISQASHFPISTSTNVNTSEFALVSDNDGNVYYKIRAEDGNEVCIPISFLEGIDQRNVELVAVSSDIPVEDQLDTQQRLPFAPQQGVDGLESINSPSFTLQPDPSTSLDCYSDKVSNISFSSNYEQKVNLRSETTKGDSDSHASESSNDLPYIRKEKRESVKKLTGPVRMRSNLTSSQSTSPSKANAFLPQTPIVTKTEVDNHSDASLVPSTSRLSINLPSRTPSCSFFFSPKMKVFETLSSAKGTARGTPPPPERPKVKFLYKGLIHSRKK